MTAGIKKYKSIIKKKKKEHDKIVLLGKDKFNNIEIIISKSLIGSYISNDEFVLVNNVCRKLNDMKEETKTTLNFCEIYYGKWNIQKNGNVLCQF